MNIRCFVKEIRLHFFVQITLHPGAVISKHYWQLECICAVGTEHIGQWKCHSKSMLVVILKQSVVYASMIITYGHIS